MNFVSRNGSRTTIRQIPLLLFCVAGMFSVPMLSFSLVHLIRGTDAEGKYFTLFFGSAVLGLMLEFVATRERILVDPSAGVLERTVSGLFRKKSTRVILEDVTEVGVEWRVNSRGRRREHVFLYGPPEPVLMNSPEKVYLNHSRLAKLIAEALARPYVGEKEPSHLR